jgi:plasmid maintenance system killer protein
MILNKMVIKPNNKQFKMQIKLFHKSVNKKKIRSMKMAKIMSLATVKKRNKISIRVNKMLTTKEVILI